MFTLRFDQVLDAGSVGPGIQLAFSARDTGVLSNEPATKSWPFPFGDASRPRRMDAAEGTVYAISTSWTG